ESLARSWQPPCPAAGSTRDSGSRQRSCRGPVPSIDDYAQLTSQPCMWLMVRCGSVVELSKIRRRIEPGKQQQPGEKAADMRLPGDDFIGARQRRRPQAEEEIQAKPDCQKGDHRRLAQRARERQRRHMVGGVAAAPEAEWPAAPEGK